MLNVLKTVYELLSPYERRRAAGVFVLMLGTALFELLGVGSILPFLSIATDPDIVHRSETLNWLYTNLGFESLTNFIIFAGVVILAIIVLTNLIAALSVRAQMWFVYNVGHGLSVRLMDRYLAKPYAYFLTHNTSELSKNVLAETSKLVTGVLKPGASLLLKGIVVVAIVGLLFTVEPLITLFAMVVFGGTYALVYARIRKTLERIGRKSVKANQLRYKTNAEAFGGIKEVKTLGIERYFLQEYGNASLRYTSYQVTSQIYAQLPRYLIHTIAFGGFMGIFIFLIASGHDMSQVVPLMGFFAFAAVRLLPAFQEILGALAQFRYHEHLLRKIHSDLLQGQRLDRALARPRQDLPALPFDHGLALEGVRFRYPGTNKEIISDLTLEVPKNSSVALVGTTGAGKTTVVDIILGLLVPDEGFLTVDGTKITPENVAGWQKRIGYVPQDIFLTDDTVVKNIAYGIDDGQIDHDAVQRAACIAHIHDFIVNELTHGYETVIGERGVRISGGQRQRLGIARALYHNPDVLVLDEATSDIDNITEAHITEAIQRLAGKKTLIIVAHRLATVRKCERICVVLGGRIVAQGTYNDLLDSSRQFRELALEPQATVKG